MESKSVLARLNDLERRIRKQLDDTPLSMVGAALTDVVDWCRCAVQAAPDDLHRVGRARDFVPIFEANLRALPDGFGSRFGFDHWVLSTLLRSLASSGAPVSVAATPNYKGGWGYSKIRVPMVEQDDFRAVHIYHFDGADIVEDVQLYTYGWLFHEVSHALMRSETETFRNDLTAALDLVLSQSRKQIFSLKGEAKRHLQEHLLQLEKFWTPSRDHDNWAHEIAMDVVAIYMAGPSYGWLLHREANKQANLFEISEGHPPFAARMAAALVVCRDLGFQEMAEVLDADCAHLIDAASAPKPATYSMYVREALILATVRTAVSCAKNLGVPRFDLAAEEEAERLIGCGSPPENGFMAIIMAVAIHRRRDAEAYDRWQRQLIKLITMQ